MLLNIKRCLEKKDANVKTFVKSRKKINYIKTYESSNW